MNPNDEIRTVILHYFYDRNANATSRMGKKGSAVKISDVKRELKQLHGLKQQQVMANLTHLTDNGWIKTIDVEKTVNVGGGTVPSVTIFYEISAKGIDKIEGGSQFEPQDRYAGININAVGQNIITLGDGNVVNAEFRDLHDALGELKEAISASKELPENEKLDLAVDVESIKDQLGKTAPNRGVVANLWIGMQRIATVSSVAEAFAKVTVLIGPLLS